MLSRSRTINSGSGHVSNSVNSSDRGSSVVVMVVIVVKKLVV